MRFIRISGLATTNGRPGLLPVSPATIWRWCSKGIFPKPRKLSERVTAWPLAEVEAWIEAKLCAELLPDDRADK